MIRQWATGVAVAVTGLAFVLVAAGPAAAAAPAAAPSTADIGTERAMVFDPAHQRTFVGGTEGIAVFDAGLRVAKVFPIPSTALLLHDGVLYVGGENAVARVDASTLRRLAPLAVDQIGRVTSLAFAGGRVWVSAGDVPGSGLSGVLRSIDPATGALGRIQAESTRALLVAAPQRPSALWLVGNNDPFASDNVQRFAVRGATATLERSASVPAVALGITAAAAAPNGSTLAVQGLGSSDGVVELNGSTLAPTGVRVLAANGGARALSAAVVAGSNDFVAVLAEPRGAARAQQFAFGETTPDRYYVFGAGLVDVALTPNVLVGALTSAAGLTRVQVFATTS